VTVEAVARPVERLARVTFTGPDLVDLPDEEPGEVLTLIWPDGHARNFTIRSYDRVGAAIEVDFILHGDTGTASAWACRAQRGQKLGFYGPRVHFIEDPEAAWTLLAGDETALPAIAATLARAPAGRPILAFVEADPAAARREDVDLPPGATLTWLERKVPAHASRELERAVRAASLPPGRGKVWLAGEAGVVRGLRTYLRDECEIGIAPQHAVGYWKHRETPDDVEGDLQ
jgi:NADPH-dependent ferric siderophore reductase